MKRIVGIVLTVLIGSFCGVHSADAAVDFRAGVNRDTIAIGDPIVFRMRLIRGVGDVTTFEYGDAFPDPFDILEKRPVQTESLTGDRVQETRDMILTVFQLGQFDIPSVSLRYVLANGDSGRVASRVIPVLTQSIRSEGETEIRDVKPPVAIKGAIPAWAWISLLALIALTAFGVWYYRSRKKRPETARPDPPIDWVSELSKIQRLGLVEPGDYHLYYSFLSDILRRCIEAKTPVRAVEETTFEIARDLRLEGTADRLVGEIETFLIQADMVKFAKFVPSVRMAVEAMTAAESIVRILIKPKEEAVHSITRGEAT
ncbi:MAG: hypothetical protein O3B73_17815 [bacterium]|nr:hypothetical protein [bacterium]